MQPFLFLVSGLSGTGKSTVAQKLAVDYHAVQINTDVLRKAAAGIDQYEPHHDPVNAGLYAPKNIDDTYGRVIENAVEVLKNGGNVVLDATFQKRKYRVMAHHIATQNHASFIMIHCICPDDVVKKRLEERLQKKSVSDGRWDIYLAQKRTFEAFTAQDPVLTFDTSKESYDYRMGFFQQLLSCFSEVN